jgi:hypothetical protein
MGFANVLTAKDVTLRVRDMVGLFVGAEGCRRRIWAIGMGHIDHCSMGISCIISTCLRQPEHVLKEFVRVVGS